MPGIEDEASGRAPVTDMTPRSDRARGWALWPWLTLLPFGQAPFLPMYAGARAGVTRWIAYGAAWIAVEVAGVLWAAASNRHDHGIGGGLILLSWVGSIVTSFAISRRYCDRMAAGCARQRQRALEQLHD